MPSEQSRPNENSRRTPWAAIRSWITKLNRVRAERIWERDQQRECFRNIILATRRIQDTQRAFDQDVAEVCGLRSHIEHARPEMERLGTALESSQEVFERLHEKLGLQEEMLSARLEDAGAKEERERLERQAQELTRALEERGEELRTLRATIAALRLTRNDPPQRGGVDARTVQLLKGEIERERRTRLEAEESLARVRARNEELEAEAGAAFLLDAEREQCKQDLAEVGGSLEQRIDEMHELVSELSLGTGPEAQAPDVSAEKVADLEQRLRQSEIARLDIEARFEQEIGDFADHSRTRVLELQSRIAELEAALALESVDPCLPEPQETEPREDAQALGLMGDED